jgi:hypothetical protein
MTENENPPGGVSLAGSVRCDSELTTDEARRLTDLIKVSGERLWELIERAYLERAWAALDYDSWDSYVDEEFGTARFRLPREERAEVVTSMREAGLSIRAISAVTGDSYSTTRNVLTSSEDSTEQNCSVDDGTQDSEPRLKLIVGRDGKKRRQPRLLSPPKRKAGKSNRRPPAKTEANRIAAELTDITGRLKVLYAQSKWSLDGGHHRAIAEAITQLSETWESLNKPPERPKPIFSGQAPDVEGP